MIEIILSESFEERSKKKSSIVSSHKGEIIVIDRDDFHFDLLEDYAYPSLFVTTNFLVYSKYLLGSSTDLRKELIKVLVSSPTLFVLEERKISANILKSLEKEGAIVHSFKNQKAINKKNNIFSVTNAITAPLKKDRWLAFQKSLQEHSAEALIGILYWKLKSLIDENKSSEKFKDFYTRLMVAQKQSWQKGTPLSLAIEKVILEN